MYKLKHKDNKLKLASGTVFLASLIASSALTGCASYSIQSINNVKNGVIEGVPYMLPKTKMDITAQWTIMQCEDDTKPILRARVTETLQSIADYEELYVVNTSNLSGGLANDTAGISLTPQGILTGFDVASVGKAGEVFEQVIDLTAPFLGPLLGVPVIGGGFAPLGTVPAPPTSPICEIRLNGNKVGDILKERDDLRNALAEVSRYERQQAASLTDISKSWISAKNANDRRAHLTSRLATLDHLLTFDSGLSFDLEPGTSANLSIEPGNVRLSANVDDPLGGLAILARNSRIDISVNSLSSISSKGYTKTELDAALKKDASAVVYRVPAPVEVNYTRQSVMLASTEHLSSQAGPYAQIPLKSALFGTSDTKLVFDPNGMLTSYKLTEETGLASSLESANKAVGTIKGVPAAQSAAQTAAYEAELKRLEAKKKLEDYIAENGGG